MPDKHFMFVSLILNELEINAIETAIDWSLDALSPENDHARTLKTVQAKIKKATAKAVREEGVTGAGTSATL